MKNLVQMGNCLELTAPAGGVVSGTAYLIGAIVVVAADDADAGDAFVGHRVGSFLLPVGSSTPSEGQKAYFVTASNSFSTTASGNTLCGAFVGPKDADDNAEVLLTGQVV